MPKCVMMLNRNVKRVPLDFSWPLNEVWEGYLNPHDGVKECPACYGTGYNRATHVISEAFYNLSNREKAWHDKINQDEVQALIDAGRLCDFTHTWSQKDGRVKKDPPCIPTAKEVNTWENSSIGHDAINRWILIEARAKRLGVYGKCSFCGGDGEIKNKDKEEFLNYENWKPKEPPIGKGLQCWETTSEGSPMSPVFKTLDELCEWLSRNTGTHITRNMTKDDWMDALKEPCPLIDLQGNKIKKEASK